jgi:hypothetical protein
VYIGLRKNSEDHRKAEWLVAAVPVLNTLIVILAVYMYFKEGRE